MIVMFVCMDTIPCPARRSKSEDFLFVHFSIANTRGMDGGKPKAPWFVQFQWNFSALRVHDALSMTE